MGIAHRLSSLAHDFFTPISVSEADIREELECHMELRTLENVAAGMQPEDARKDALKRFGDFDRNFRSCCDASLGIRRWLRRLQLAMIVGLLGAVAMLGVSLMQMQSKYESEISTLESRIAAQVATGSTTTGSTFTGSTSIMPPKPSDNRIPVRQWSLPLREIPSTNVWNGEAPFESLSAPWSDWSALDS